jgi:hypothetical protein
VLQVIINNKTPSFGDRIVPHNHAKNTGKTIELAQTGKVFLS